MGIDLSAIANHNIAFTDPLEFLEQLKEEKGIPYFISYMPRNENISDILPPKDFEGLVITYYDDIENQQEAYEKDKSFDLYYSWVDNDLYISNYCFAGFSPNINGRWYWLVRALTNTKQYADDEFDDILEEFNEKRKILFNWITILKGTTAVYSCDHTADVWEYGLIGKTIEEVISYAKENYPVYKYPDELALMQQLDFDKVCRSLIIIDTFSDLK